MYPEKVIWIRSRSKDIGKINKIACEISSGQTKRESLLKKRNMMVRRKKKLYLISVRFLEEII